MLEREIQQVAADQRFTVNPVSGMKCSIGRHQVSNNFCAVKTLSPDLFTENPLSGSPELAAAESLPAARLVFDL